MNVGGVTVEVGGANCGNGRTISIAQSTKF